MGEYDEGCRLVSGDIGDGGGAPPASPVTRSIPVDGYFVHVAPGLLDRLGAVVRRDAPACRYAIVTDVNVGPLYAERAAAAIGNDVCSVFPLRAGEEFKTRESWAWLTDALIENGFGRDTTIVALGGGVVGDVAGFVAATFMRGIPYIQVPTTLLAMIDAAIGGKTGVDTPAGKNLVGAIHRPATVMVDPLFLQTLPLRQLRAGMAEAFKHGIIADAGYFDRISHCTATAFTETHVAVELIARSVEIKADIVRRDELEQGPRKALNFGHTIGHAIEVACGYRILHGEAVAMGMALEAEIAERANVAQQGTASTIRDALKGAGLPSARPRELSADILLAATRTDKKARGGASQYALPVRIGEMASAASGWTVHIDDALVLEVLG